MRRAQALSDGDDSRSVQKYREISQKKVQRVTDREIQFQSDQCVQSADCSEYILTLKPESV